MSFHESAVPGSIRLEGPCLHALLRDEQGGERPAMVDLDQFIGNNDGHFQWGGNNFFETARGVYFDIEGGANVPVLRAELRDEQGGWRTADVNLAERLFNINGRFEFQ
ncbi:CVNH domain-containing protein [Aspergillus homomorphus CBS 101889]|uniref:Cyanovirin-N n=1 Tax=Aspergillus homomorphus (strain CBS 101889) TaxID=1450537 RepID=A0A395HZV4_ASPHC|nr:Cyanovirin-N [Aspergillus homomorphus CBS 101889]RAL11804.1 Cyanovirin-N [Aspergillus homomorphus CBS 101889]